MRIGIDARALQHETQYRGIGKALHFLLQAMKSELHDDDLVFYVDAGLPRPKVLAMFTSSKVISVPTSRMGRTRYIRSVLPSFKPLRPLKKDIDVLLQYDVNLGVPKNIPTVCMFHDLIPYLFRGQEKQLPAPGLRKYKNALAGSLYWRRYLRSLKGYARARHILAISESSKRDLLQYFPEVDKRNVTVVYLGVNSAQVRARPSKLARSLAAKPFLLYVGGIDFRKNIKALVCTFYDLKDRHPDLRLIAVGKEFELTSQLRDVGWTEALQTNSLYAHDVVTPGFLSDEDLQFLYVNAAAFIFPSRYEGFGLPVIEALYHGTPVVAYNNSSIPEVAGKGALLVADGRPLAPSVHRILSSSALRESLKTNGLKHSSTFSWQKTARETLSVLQEVAYTK